MRVLLYATDRGHPDLLNGLVRLFASLTMEFQAEIRVGHSWMRLLRELA